MSSYFLSMVWNRVDFTQQFMLLLVPRACRAAALVCWLMVGVHVVSRRRGD